MSGSSFAAPLVAGCAAILRRQLLKKYGSEQEAITQVKPTAALMKALLINGATDMYGSKPRGPTPIGHPPGKYQGFGRMNMAKTLENTNNVTFGGYLECAPLSMTGSTPQSFFEKPITFQPPAKDPSPGVDARLTISLKVTMVYTDLPGAATQNSLTLKVTGADGTVKYGNNGNKLDPTAQDTPDVVNNVQQIYWQSIPTSEATIRVDMTKEGQAQAKQDFALVWWIEWGAPSDKVDEYKMWVNVMNSEDALKKTFNLPTLTY